ncbi:MAG: hypothetical protein KBT03_00215 [Bacteroidales bacterium]|nr:hypothetical protein [Candidatus Scybalousia scybalohippi]
MKKLSIKQFDSEFDYKQAKKQLKKQELNKRKSVMSLFDTSSFDTFTNKVDTEVLYWESVVDKSDNKCNKQLEVI